jgi:hypothetical protein
MQFDPKLKKAMAEIDAILLKYDCAGIIVLHRPGMGEYKYSISPSYSSAKVKNKNTVHFKAKLSDFNGDKRQLAYQTAATANMLHMLGTKAGEVTLTIMQLSTKFDAISGAEHSGHREITPPEQDN